MPRIYAEILQSSKAELYRADLMPPTERTSPAPHPHLTRISVLIPSRILHFCTFHKFLHVFFAHQNSRKTYWHLADPRCSGSDPEKNGTPVFNEFLHFFSENIKWKKHRKNSDFQNTYWYTATGVPPGSSRVLFFRIPEIRKTHFSEKGPRSEKTRHFTISYGFSSKERSADFRPPQNFQKKSEKCLKK